MVSMVQCGYLAGQDLHYVPSGRIAIDGDRIADVQPVDAGAPARGAPDGFEFGNCVAVPGLVNCHVHLRDAVALEAAAGRHLEESVIGTTSIRAQRIAASTQSERLVAIERALHQMERLGISLVCDFCDGGIDGVLETKKAASAARINVVVLGRLSCPQPIEAVRANEGLSANQRSELDRLIEVADGFATATVNDYSDVAWKQIQSRVRAARKLISVHLAEHASQCASSRDISGGTDVERVLAIEPDHVVHLTQISEQGLDQILKSGIPVVVCPRSNGVMGLGHPPLLQLLKAGHVIGLGTDNIMLNSPNLWREMEYAAKSYRAAMRDPTRPSACELLSCGTWGGARALRLDHTVGSIDVGKRANFLVVRKPGRDFRTPEELFAVLAHRLEPGDIVGRFHDGEWIPNPLHQFDAN